VNSEEYPWPWRPPVKDEMLALAAGVVVEFGLQPRVRRRV
jgi:hypothetical protein